MQKPNGSFVKKVFAAGLAVTTALWALGAVLVLPVAAVEAHPAGTLVLSGGTVWHVSDNGTGRHGIDSLAKFQSHRFDFADVVPANSADLALPDLGLLSWGNGVLFNEGGTVYQVSGGTKHGFTSASVFTGNGFDFATVIPASLAGVPVGANISDTVGAHLEGTFVVSGGTIWMITATGRKGFDSAGKFYSYGAGFGHAAAANAADLASSNEGIASYRTGTLVNDSGTVWAVTATAKRGFPTASCFTGFGFNFSMPVTGGTSSLTAGSAYCVDTTTPPPPPPTTGSGTLSMSLASDTPVAATAVDNAARFGFTKANFTASGGDVTIDSITVERTGISTDGNFTDIILLDVSNGVSVGQANQLGNERSLTSLHRATFGDDIVVKNGTTKSILVAANMAAALNAADQAKLEIVEVAVAGSATKSGSLPIAGNTMTMNTSVAIAAVTVQASASPSATTQTVGTNDYAVTGFTIANNSVEKVEVQSIKLTENGSAGDSDVKNLELLVDGSVIASVANPVSKIASFVLASPLVIDKGVTKTVDVRLDIADGSARTISLDIDKKADVVAKGQTYGYFVTPTYKNSAGTTVSTSPYLNPSDTTIGNGSITFSKGVLASLNIAEGTTGQTLGAFKATVQGEPVQVTVFPMGVTIGGGTATPVDVTNLRIKDENGVFVGGPVDTDTVVTTRDTATSTDTITFPVGTHTYTIIGDLNTDFIVNNTVQLDIPDPDGLVTAKGSITNQTLTANPTSDLSLDTVTVKSGGLNVSTSATPAAQSVIIGQAGFTFANFNFDASGSGEDVKVTQLAVVHKTQANSTQTNIANLTIYDGATALTPIVQPTAVAATNATSTFSFTNPVVITKGQSKTLTLKGDVVTGTSGTHTHSFGCVGTDCITAIGATTGTTVTESTTNSDGQTMTLISSGTMTVSAAGSNPTAKLVAGNSSKITVGELLLTSASENVGLSEIHFTGTAVNSGALNDEFTTFYLFDGATQIASASPTTTAAITFTGLDGLFTATPAGKVLTVKADTSAITNNAADGNIGDSGDGVSLDVAQDAYTAKGISSGSKLAASATSGTFTGNAFTVYKSLPTWTKQALSTNTLVNSSGVPLFKFKLAADAKGDVGFYKASFAVTTTTATVTAWQLFEIGTEEVNITANATRSITECLIAGVDGKNSQCVIDFFFDTGTDGVGNGGEFRTIPAGQTRNYEVRASVSNSVTGSSVSVIQRGDNAFTTSSPSYPDCAGGASGANACTGIADAEQGNFVWSDLAFGNSTTTATNTAEWFNGYRVAGMTTTSTAENVAK